MIGLRFKHMFVVLSSNLYCHIPITEAFVVELTQVENRVKLNTCIIGLRSKQFLGPTLVVLQL